MSDDNTSSSPQGHGRQDEVMDKEFDKIFQDDRFNPATLNPTGTGNVDEGRNYYRSASVDMGQGGEAMEGPGGVMHSDSPLQGHDRHEYPQSRSILSKHQKKHQQKRGHAGLPAIPGGDGDADDDQDEPEDTEQQAAPTLPWKASSDRPVLDSEHAYSAQFPTQESVTPPVFSVEKEPDQEKKKVDLGGVKFTLGGEDSKEEALEDHSGHRQYRRPSSQLRKGKKEEENWKRIGSELRAGQPKLLPEEEGINDLLDFDIDDIGTHRFEKAAGLGRHMLKKSSHATDPELGSTLADPSKRHVGFGFQKEVDHTPHNLFVEMDELEGDEWVEKARWIKYEEDLEAEAGRWGAPHVSSLSFRSLINVRVSLEQGVMLLDLMETDLPGIVHRVVEQLSVEGVIEEDKKPEILRILNYRHKYVQPKDGAFKRSIMKRSGSQKSLPDTGMNGSSKDKDSTSLTLDMENNGSMKRTGSGYMRRNQSDVAAEARKADILSCLEQGTEGCIVLVGAIDCDKIISAFVRLGNSIVMHNTIEVDLPMRFIYVLLTPKTQYRMDPHEIGRSFSTLMSNNSFHNVCYGIDGKRELLHAINIFLDDSVVLPPGDWNKQKLLAMADIMDMRKRRAERKEAAIDAGLEKREEALEESKQKPELDKEEKKEDDKPIRNPLERSKIPFGGLIDDIMFRYPLYWQDIKDGLNAQCMAAIIFIYFAALSGAIAFGGLMGAKTGNDIGISETLILSSITGILFALFAGCPLIIIGTTGPVLLYDEALFGFSASMEIEYLSWRTWVGIWTFIISLLVAGFQGSTLVKHFTKFTKDIFAALVSLLFIFEAIRKLAKIFQAHPLEEVDFYCTESGYTQADNTTMSTLSILGAETSSARQKRAAPEQTSSPNTALLSAILMFGTFFIAYFLRGFRTSKIFGRTARRAMADFGVPIAIVIMVLIDFSAKDTYTEKLNVPTGITVTNSTKRGWFIPPTGNQETLPVWAMFAGVLPAILLYLLLFMETHICELIMLEKTKGEKGVGIHLDIVLLSFLNMFSSLLGGPWICAATVRAVSHVSALVIVSANPIPGESPKLVGIRDQRVSALVVSILLGFSVLMAPILKLVPFAVLFGVFLYMGVTGMNGVQFFDRLQLIFMPVKHHPQVSYVKKVKTWRMILFTAFQALGLIILWIVKSTPAAIAFPFFVIGMIPLRFSLKYVFTEKELDALDGPEAGKDLSGAKDEDIDFFDAAGDVPIVPHSAIPLHRSIMGLMNITGVPMPDQTDQERGK